MRRILGPTTLATTAVAAAVALYVGFTLPPRAVRLEGQPAATFVTGAFHVHTSRSDGSGSVDDVAAAAARAGLAFVIFTDHGDATRAPDAPAYRHGVLCIDAVEINTSSGHVVALGLTGAAPFPLAGHPRDVIEDIHRLGGTAIVAHPDSPRASLRWRGQNIAVDGIEWLNIDSEWRDESAWRLVSTAARSLIRGPEAVASLLSRPSRSLERLDSAARQRPAFGIAALDAHARVAWRDAEEPRGGSAIRFPSYDVTFRTAAQSLILDQPLSGVADDDASRVIDALTNGRSFSIVRAYAEPGSLVFTARQGDREVGMGGRLDESAEATTFSAAVLQAPGARLVLMANGRQVATGQGKVEFSSPTSPGAYRVEVLLPGRPAPWILSNPIVIGPVAQTAPPPEAEPADGRRVPLDTADWTIERESASSASLASEDDALRLAFQLAPGSPRGQYAAVATSVRAESGVDHIRFVGRSSRPLRLSVQIRLPGGPDGRRWRRSVYLDEEPRTVTISLRDFDPVEPYTSQRPVVSPIQSLLFVIDTLNTLPGTDGVVWISNVELGVREP